MVNRCLMQQSAFIGKKLYSQWHHLEKSVEDIKPGFVESYHFMNKLGH